MHLYDATWKRVSRQFWKYRRRELAFHLILFLSINLPLWFLATNLPDGSFLRFNVGQYVMGIYLNWVYIPWITVWWGLLLLTHLIAFVSAQMTERLFRFRIEREFLREYIDQSEMEKPKRHPFQPDDEAFDYEEAIPDEKKEVMR